VLLLFFPVRLVLCLFFSFPAALQAQSIDCIKHANPRKRLSGLLLAAEGDEIWRSAQRPEQGRWREAAKGGYRTAKKA
jgi:hypothetical protein